jgi:protein tyrosine/serine phosphatase
MLVLSADINSRIIEIDKSIFDEAKEFLIDIAKKKKKSLSYIDEIGDKIVVINGKEYVEPTKEDIEDIYSMCENDFIDESEVKRLLDV